jgi:hypothetical protein
VLAVAGLCWREPLQSCAVFGGLNANAELQVWRCRLDLLVANVDRERATIWLNTLLREVPLGLLSIHFDADDFQVAGS